MVYCRQAFPKTIKLCFSSIVAYASASVGGISMKLSSRIRLFLAFSMLLVPMIACGGLFGGDEASEPVAEVAPVENTQDESNESAATEDPAAESQAESSTDSSSAGDASAPITLQPSLPLGNDSLPFQTYQIRMEISSTSQDNTSTMQMNHVRDVPNQSASYQVSASGVPDMAEFGGDSMSLVMLENKIYLPADGECMAIDAGAFNPMDEFPDGSEILQMDAEVETRLIGESVLNGLSVKEYQLTGLDTPDMADAAGSLFVHTLPDGQDVVVKTEITARSERNMLTDEPVPSDIRYTLELFGIDEPVTIGLPAGCENAMEMPAMVLPDVGNDSVDVPAADAPADPASNPISGQAESASGYPVYPGSSFGGGFAGAENYMIPQGAIAAQGIAPKDFFAQEFGAQGFSVISDLVAGPTVILTMQSTTGGTLQITLMEEGGDVNATILSMPQ
jgi:hypothetical protein